jgi:hypothetical protein
MGVDRVIETCADADDPSLREYAAFAANFWNGSPQENARIEKALLRLCDDPGKGELELAKFEDENTEQKTRQLVKKPGFRVQANAAIAWTMIDTLKAVAELHRKNPRLDLSSLRPNIDKLADNSNAAVRTEAGRVVLVLNTP